MGNTEHNQAEYERHIQWVEANHFLYAKNRIGSQQAMYMLGFSIRDIAKYRCVTRRTVLHNCLPLPGGSPRTWAARPWAEKKMLLESILWDPELSRRIGLEPREEAVAMKVKQIIGEEPQL